MKTAILSLEGRKTGETKLPEQFKEEIREDLIRKAVKAIQANKRQRYGAKTEAGKRYSAKLSRRRRNYKGAYGRGISRIPRKTMTRRGRQFFWVGALAPGTVGGRRAHPPKAEKKWSKSINIKERRKAIRSALAATCVKEIVEKRGHRVRDVPIIIEAKIEDLKKAKDVKETLEKIGLKEELERISERRIRAGKGKSRGRKYQIKKGPLLVVGDNCELLRSAGNLQGIDVENVKKLNAEMLAPGAHIGRLTVYSQKAIERLEKEQLFMNKPKKEEKKVREKKEKKEKTEEEAEKEKKKETKKERKNTKK